MASTATAIDTEMQARLHDAWHKCGVPARYLDVPQHFEDIPRIREYLEVSGNDLYADIASGTGLYLWGSIGTGKTYAACSILKAHVPKLMARYGSYAYCRFVSSVQWLDAIQETYPNRDSTEDAFQRAAGTRLLVFDDIGKATGRMNAWTVARLYRLIDERYNANLPTIFTSQYPLESLAERLELDGDTETAEAIRSRIYGACKRISFRGEDQRIKQGGQS